MPLTPDNELELLFDPKYIPERVREMLPAGYHMRPLALTDYARGHLEVLKGLNAAPERAHGPAAYAAQFQYQLSIPDTYFIVVIVHEASDAITATGTIIVERKYRGMSRIAHLEDIAVAKSEQGGRLGWLVMYALIAISDSMGCYKLTGRGDPRIIPYYNKLKSTIFADRKMTESVTLDLYARL